jgi:enoyl-CoA hydratase
VGTYLEEALKLAEEIASRAPLAIRAAKKMVNLVYEESLSAGLIAEKFEFYNLFSSEDQKEGMQAFIDKRKPEWKGR